MASVTPRQLEPFRAQIKGNSPNIIFLSETKAIEARMKEVLFSLKFASMCVVEAKGTTGVLCVMWKAGFSISQVEFNKNLIAIKVSNALRDWVMVSTTLPTLPRSKRLGRISWNFLTPTSAHGSA